MKRLIPQPLLNAYHLAYAYGSAFFYGFPSRKIILIGVTGTKGKSTTAELIRTILSEAGHKVALASTIRFMIGKESEPNLFKMTMPGRGYLQYFLRKAVKAGATHAVIEMTSEGTKQFRHRALELDALVFTNLQPEHLESHGGLENYAKAKLQIAKQLEISTKRPRYIVANMDDAYGKAFLAAEVEHKVPFSLTDAEPYNTDDRAIRFVWKRGELFTVPLPGLFNLRNILAALVLTDAMGVPQETIKKALEHVSPIAGRAERVEKGQRFAVVIDYAHTPDSLRALFETFKHKRIISIIGSTGGGRDTWNRPEKGKIADEFCDVSIIANEDPYDEDPDKIIAEISKGFSRKHPVIILNRRKAIAEALSQAKEGDAVLITGKGTDPYIMGPKGTKEVWSDKKVAEEELEKLGFTQ